MYRELKLREIEARGWVKKFLENQAKGLTGEMGKVGKPFVSAYWEGDKNLTVAEDENFLGGLNCADDAWTPFEQNGYWIDGMVRCGWLSGNAKLIKQAENKIYPAIQNADEDGYIGPAFLKDGMTWAHTVYFRALIAEYEATGDSSILEALKKHYLRVPLKERISSPSGARIIAVRDIAEIEIALWIYGETADERFLQMSEEAYAVFNDIYSDDTSAPPEAKMRDLTVKGMLCNRKVNRNHGVTYHEICKLAAILHLYTGKEVYKKAAVNAFDKLYRDQMLIDGVNSSTEYLNGNYHSHAAHETCDISDFTWAVGYLFMITGDAKYGDWVENAVFNAGLGAVDDDFKGQQYFSCPNQVIADDTSNHAYFYRGEDWMSYAPKKFLSCCAGNVHRFMPNFAARSWMRSDDGLAAFVYAPTKVETEIDGRKIKIIEDTMYPFENIVRFRFFSELSVKFLLALRVPCWALHTSVTINGKEYPVQIENGFVNLKRDFANGDEVIISFEDRVEMIENARGISVKKGALLYALPVKEKCVVEGLRDQGNVAFPHYALYADSKWNFGIQERCLNAISFHDGSVGDEPWRHSENNLSITVSARELKGWKLQRVKNCLARTIPRGKGCPMRHEAQFTPKVKTFRDAEAGEESQIRLVPYGTTRLRIAIFPLIKNKESI